MMQSHIEEVSIPSQSLVLRAFTNIDYADAYRIKLTESVPPLPQSVDALTRAIFSSMPHWVWMLLRLRDSLVRPLGLKISQAVEPKPTPVALQPGMKVGIFEVWDRKSNEVLMGEDDYHLDYRVSVCLEQEANYSWVVVSTVIRFNNWLGRIYFLPVKPLHRVIVPALIRYGLVKYSKYSK